MFGRTAKIADPIPPAPVVRDPYRITAVSVHDEDYGLLEWKMIDTDVRPTEVVFTAPKHWRERKLVRVATWTCNGIAEWLDYGVTHVTAGTTINVTLTPPREWLGR